MDSVEDTPYLGVQINRSLKWNHHVDMITAKANKILGLLRRNMRHTPKAVKEVAYQTLVRPRLEYCSAIWDPHTAILKNKLEKVQRAAARFVLGRPYFKGSTESVTEMIKELKWDTLEKRRTINALNFTYKLTNNIIAIPPAYHPKELKSSSRNTNQRSFQTFQPRVDAFKYSLLPRIIPTWNKLPTEAVTAQTLDIFKSHVQKL